MIKELKKHLYKCLFRDGEETKTGMFYAKYLSAAIKKATKWHGKNLIVGSVKHHSVGKKEKIDLLVIKPKDGKGSRHVTVTQRDKVEDVLIKLNLWN